MASTRQCDPRSEDTARIVTNMAAQLQIASSMFTVLARSVQGSALDISAVLEVMGEDKSQVALSLSRQTDLAASELRQRRFRERIFPPGLFGDPAWDILLDLFVAEARGNRVSVTDACLAAAVPMTTALRWVRQLESVGLVVRRADERDARRAWLVLTQRGTELVGQVMTFGQLGR